SGSPRAWPRVATLRPAARRGDPPASARAPAGPSPAPSPTARRSSARTAARAARSRTRANRRARRATSAGAGSPSARRAPRIRRDAPDARRDGSERETHSRDARPSAPARAFLHLLDHDGPLGATRRVEAVADAVLGERRAGGRLVFLGVDIPADTHARVRHV